MSIVTITVAGPDGVIKEVETVSNGFDLSYVDPTDKSINHVMKMGVGDYNKDNYLATTQYMTLINRICDVRKNNLHNFATRKMRVLVDTKFKKTKQSKPNSCWKASIKKVSAEYNILTGYEYIITIREFYLEEWSPEQIEACLFGLLSQIQEDGSIRKHQLDDGDTLAYVLGAGYLEPEMNILSILDPEVKLKTVDKAAKNNQQITMDETLDEESEEEKVEELIE